MTSELDKSEGTRQESTLSENNFSARHIKLTILSGYDHFVAVYHLQVGTLIMKDSRELLLTFKGTWKHGSKHSAKVFCCQVVWIWRGLERDKEG